MRTLGNLGCIAIALAVYVFASSYAPPGGTARADLIPRLAWTPNRVAGDIGWRARGESRVGHNGMGGEMVCHDGIPHIEPMDSSLVGLERDENILHELMHQQQFEPGCDSMMILWGTIPIYRIELESQASCYGLQVYSGDSLFAYHKGLAAVRITAANGVGFEDVYAALDRWCVAPTGTKP